MAVSSDGQGCRGPGQQDFHGTFMSHPGPPLGWLTWPDGGLSWDFHGTFTRLAPAAAGHSGAAGGCRVFSAGRPGSVTCQIPGRKGETAGHDDVDPAHDHVGYAAFEDPVAQGPQGEPGY